mmetsp:Transcript_23173/g.53103  ORF Transcript_23173/g.53103 Transcript_23173/m.53103 type:complete len:81 (+) Transcript_23173:92-334(+)|eukprot:CAMPEP_0197893830 /NCGR_PEP_ID=MMETSP1439-20131203/33536_1 /TAXON_ID=66791 /ORGANISM="Gonyaulax spinifera, Strain CCMP409" /LENGTH=80 /DNA_ID=CAMNT_0043514127 /DNA_START=86 /DNA_END=328 /DNA_ORIENTATION=+
MLDFLFGFGLGLGIGAFNAAKGLRECMDDTFHVTKKTAISAKQQAGPHAQRLQEAAIPYAKQLSSKISDQVAAIKQQRAA